MNKEELTARAQELKIEVPVGATNQQIGDLIKIAEHPNLKKELKQALDVVEGHKELAEKAKEETSVTLEKLKASEDRALELEQELEALTKAPEPQKGEIYKNEDGEFEFTVTSFRFKGEKHVASVAIENKALMEELIQAKFIHLKKQ